MTLSSSENFNAALGIIDTVWSILSEYSWYRDDKAPLNHLPDLSPERAGTLAKIGRDLLDRVATIDIDSLPEDLPYTLELARHAAQQWVWEEKWYWLLMDPTMTGMYGVFAPTAYGAGWTFHGLEPRFLGYQFATPADADRYVALVRDYGRLVRQMLERTKGQAERGIHMPRVQLEQSIPLIEGFRAGVDHFLVPQASRCTAMDADALIDRITKVIAADVLPAFDAFAAFLGMPAYAAAAPEAVGLSQYPGGPEVYDDLVRLHTTLDMTADEVHAAGLRRMADVQAQMRELLDVVGFAGTPIDYVEQIKSDPKWRASGAEEIASVFQRYIDRIAPHVDASFRFKPKAGHGVAPLPEALQASMTFGYYTPPTAADDCGRYVFNPANLSQAPLNNLAALNYHELVPGHHFHFASQNENEALHPLRRKSNINAFNEGWAEYAATLAGEVGMYSEPEERFGRLMNDAFLTTRLVVDTGMNALGWSLERARDYVRAYGFMPEKEIRSETIRYSCDIPGQALGYKLGDSVMYDLREQMRAALGNRFDIRDFHDAVLKPGALPFPLVKRHVEKEIARLVAMEDLPA